MAKFKAGDKVVRTGPTEKGVIKGGVYIVDGSSIGSYLCLVDHGYGWYERNFELYKEPEVNKPTPHKHAEVIKAWADGVKIEFRTDLREEWRELRTSHPNWKEDFEYRVKPEHKPDVVRYAHADVQGNVSHSSLVEYPLDNLKLTFDGETGKLKDSKVI